MNASGSVQNTKQCLKVEDRVKIIAVGEVLWDVFGETEFLGGAPLNFSAAMQRLGSFVALISAVGDDARGKRALDAVAQLGLSTRFIRISKSQPTGAAIVKTDELGNAEFSIPRPAAFDELAPDDEGMAALESAVPSWLYFGTLAQMSPDNEQFLHRLLDRLPLVHRFYDMNLREGHWDMAVVQRLSALADIVKLNEDEAKTLFQLKCGTAEFCIEGFCRAWAADFGIDTICITRGRHGCAIFSAGRLYQSEGFSVQVADTVGAGDAFAAAFLYGRLQGWPLPAQARFANALGAIVASRSGATPQWSIEECLSLARVNDTKGRGEEPIR